jgi:hypothetical protein
MLVSFKRIPLSVCWFLIPPSIEEASLSLPKNTGINPVSAI